MIEITNKVFYTILTCGIYSLVLRLFMVPFDLSNERTGLKNKIKKALEYCMIVCLILVLVTGFWAVLYCIWLEV